MIWVFSDTGAERIINLKLLCLSVSSQTNNNSEIELTSLIASIEENTFSGAL